MVDLTKFGLTENESKVYLALLETGLSTITKLVTKTHLHKQIIYDNLGRLIAKGLASYVIQANRKCFQAVPPDKIDTYLEEQEKEILEKRQLLQQLLPQLNALQKPNVTNATIYHGKKGLKTILEEALLAKEVLAFGAEGKFKELFGHDWENYNTRREKKKQLWKIMWNEKLKGKREHLKSIQAKYIPQEFDNPASTFLYDNKVAIIIWDETPFAILIESEKVTKSYHSTFELLWKIAQR